MSFFGFYFGATGSSGDDEVAVTPTPVPAPSVIDDQVVHTHAEHSIDRLCQFAKTRSQ